jgi:hypothetical protein
MRRCGLLFGVLVALVCCAPARAVYFDDFAPRLAFSPDGRHLYAADPIQTSTYRRVPDGGLVQIGATEPSGRAVVISPDGRFGYIAATQGDVARSMRILARDPATGLMTHIASTNLGAQQVTDMVMSADGRFLYLAEAGQDSVIIVARDIASGALRRVGAVWGGQAANDVAWLDYPWQLALPSDGRSLYVASAQGGLGAFDRNPATGALTPVAQPIARVQAMAVSLPAAGDRLYAGSLSWVRNPLTGTLGEENTVDPCPTTPGSCGLGPTAALPDGAGVAIAGFYSRKLHLAARAGSALSPLGSWNVSEAPGSGGPSVLAWAPDSRTLYAGLGYGKIAVWQRLPGPPWLQYAGVVQSSERPRGSATVTINDGALFTNTRTVTVRAGQPPGASSLRLSNTSDFNQAPFRRLSPDGSYRWKLTATGMARDVRRVHLRYLDWGLVGYPPLPGELTDDIVLDQRAPQLLSATLASRTGRAAASRVRTLRLRARDNRSGVKRMQITRRRSRPGPKRRYARAPRAPKGRGKVWVRVFDGAGNASRWRTPRRR